MSDEYIPTLEEYLKDFSDEDKINISFNGKDHFRYRVGRIRTKHQHLLKYKLGRISKKFIYIVRVRENSLY